MLPPRLSPRLDVGQALREGWQAFTRAPWSFVGFSLLLTVLQLALQALQPSFSSDTLPPPVAIDPDTVPSQLGAVLPWLRYGTVALCLILLNVVAGVILNLWGTAGMVRGAWIALQGGRPRLATFTHWDPRALLRLYLPGFLLGWGITFVVAMVLLLAVVLSQANPLLALLPGVLLLVGAIYLTVSQAFLPQLALLHDDHPFAALARGFQEVAPAWPQVVQLMALTLGLLVVGLMAAVVGLFVAWPLVVCISTAAYRQLFGPEDRNGFASSLPGGQA